MFPQKGIFDFSLNLSYILYNNTQVFKKKKHLVFASKSSLD